MKLTSNKGFSFVEIIVVISIIAILGVVATTTSNTFTNNTNNSKVTADIATIENSLVQYVTENKTLPMPKGNNKFYMEDTSYSHGIDDTPFAVSGFITESTLPKKYMNYTPMDPRTNQYYGYARTLIDSNVMRFEVAGVNSNNGDYESVVKGTYTGENGPYSLIKEYNGNDFVFDKSKNHFAYNPEEKVLIGTIDDFTGIVRIDSDELGLITDINEILEHVLVTGDMIVVEKEGTANIVFSDGSQVMLGSMDQNTELAIADMEFSEDNNLFTDIKLVLNIGSAFTQAAKLDSKSNFEVYTSDTVAAVRGTVFGVNKSDPGGTNVVVQKGAVKVEENTSNSADLVNDVSNDKIDKSPVNVTGVTDSYSTIRVNTGDSTIGLVNAGSGLITSSTGMLDNINSDVKKRIVDNIGVINNSDQVTVESVSNDPRIKIELNINRKIQRAGSALVVDNGENKFFFRNFDGWAEVLEINDNTEFTMIGSNQDVKPSFSELIGDNEIIEVNFCRKRINEGFVCTKKKKINLNVEFDRTDIINSQISKNEQLDLLVEKRKTIDASAVIALGNTIYLPGLTTKYFRNSSRNYSSTSGIPFSEEITSNIDNSWGGGNIIMNNGSYIDDDYIAIHYEGFFKATSTTHNFRLWGDDGIDLTFDSVNYGNSTYYSKHGGFPYMDYEKKANETHRAGPDNSNYGVFIPLTGLVVGKYYPIDIKYYEKTGYANFRFYDNGVISEGNFYHLDASVAVTPPTGGGASPSDGGGDGGDDGAQVIVGEPVYIDSDPVVVAPVAEKCLTASDFSADSTFGLEDCNNLSKQKFVGVNTSSFERIHSKNDSSVCLDVTGANFAGGNLIFWDDCDNRAHQQFRLAGDKLKVKDSSNKEYCLGLSGGLIKSLDCAVSTEWKLDGEYIKVK